MHSAQQLARNRYTGKYEQSALEFKKKQAGRTLLLFLSLASEKGKMGSFGSGARGGGGDPASTGDWPRRGGREEIEGGRCAAFFPRLDGMEELDVEPSVTVSFGGRGRLLLCPGPGEWRSGNRR